MKQYHLKFFIEKSLKAIEKFSGTSTYNEKNTTNSNLNCNEKPLTKTNNFSMKLPSLNLYPFDGSPADWQTFYENFFMRHSR